MIYVIDITHARTHTRTRTCIHAHTHRRTHARTHRHTHIPEHKLVDGAEQQVRMDLVGIAADVPQWQARGRLAATCH
jgi:hypothetical protein